MYGIVEKLSWVGSTYRELFYFQSSNNQGLSGDCRPCSTSTTTTPEVCYSMLPFKPVKT